MMDCKFKVGDKVKITSNTSYHNFRIGSIVEIKGFYNLFTPCYPKYTLVGEGCFIEDDDGELFEECEV